MESGFRSLPANTTTRIQKLNAMTPLKVSPALRKGKPAYWIADPYVCQSVYFGNQQNYDQYRQLKGDEAEEAVSPASQDVNYDQFVELLTDETFLVSKT